MMTQPIQIFQNLTSETTPAGGNAFKEFTVEDRRLIELRARHARAEMIGEALGELLLWLGRQFRRARAAIAEESQLRAAEAQLHRMSDRDLADLGLNRAGIPFAIRQATGLTPQIGTVTADVTPANENLRKAPVSGRASRQ